MRFLMLIAAVSAFSLLLNWTDAQPKDGSAAVDQNNCAFNGKFCSGKFTTNCCSTFCLVQLGDANGVCAPDPKTCRKKGKSCVSSDTCCSSACQFNPVGNWKRSSL